jgi:hypothetical protein
MRVSGPSDDSYFAEEQHFPLWIVAFPLLTAAAIAALTLVLAVGRLWAATAVAGALLVLVFLPLAVLHVAMTLETRVDARGLHLRIRPARWNLLPSRMTQKDVPFGEMRHVAVRAYRSLTSREFWGWHLWGLSAAKGGATSTSCGPAARPAAEEWRSSSTAVRYCSSAPPTRRNSLPGSAVGRDRPADESCRPCRMSTALGRTRDGRDPPERHVARAVL